MRSFPLQALLRFCVILGLLVALFLPTLVTPHSAQAQYPGGGYPGAGGYPGSSGSWVPCDATGAPLQSGDRRLNSDGGAYLIPSGAQPTLRNTYPIPDSADSWWFNAFSPSKYSNSGSSEYGPPGLSLYGSAGNTTTDNYGRGPIGYYDPSNHQDDRPDNIPLPPDLLGSAHGDTSDTLTAYFVWTGPGPAPASPSFIVHDSVGASASVSYGTGGATTGVSATATATLGGDSVTATAGGAGSSGPQSKDGYHVVQASVSGGVAKVPMSGSVSVDSSDSLKYKSWVDSAAGAGSSGPGTYYYSGSANGYTSASDSATASATAYPVTVVPGGLTLDGGTLKVLTGQPISATLSAPYQVDPASYQWSATGDVFYTYNEHAPSHQLILLSDDPSYTNQPQFGFYDKKADTITITCNATIVCPDGTRLPVTVTAPNITSVKPTASWGTNQSAPGVGFSDDPAHQEFEANELWYPINITVPSPFSGGSGCIAQLVTASRRIARRAINGKPSNYYNAINQPNPDGSPNWVLPGRGLDTHFPYQVGAGTDTNGNTTLTTIQDGYVWDASTTGASGDTPKQPYEADDLDGGGTDWYESSAADSFSTWVMYRYPGGVWVPLQKLDWSWSGIEEKDVYGHWSPSGSASAPASATDSSDPPQWNSVVTGGGFHPVGSN